MNAKWISINERFPPFGEVVEVYVDERLSGIKLDHAAYMQADKYTDKNFWTLHGMDEFTWSNDGFKIKYWRPLGPLPNGKKPYFIHNKHGFIRTIYKRSIIDAV